MTLSSELRFGYFLNAEYPAGTDVLAAVRREQEVVRHCAQIGLDSVFVGEHFSHGPAMWLPPIPLLSRLCAMDVDLEFGTAVLVAALHNPVVLAEEIALLDQLCGGCFTLGLSAGWNRAEFAALGVDPKERVSRLRETVTVLRLLWGNHEPQSHDGRHHRFDDLALTLRPLQDGGPPIWIGASTPPGINRAACLADGWVVSSHVQGAAAQEQSRVYADARAELGLPRPARRPALRNVYVAATREQALRDAGPFLTASYRTFEQWGLFSEVLGETQAVDYEVAARRAVIGSPEEVAEQLATFMTTADVNELLVRVQWTGMPAELIHRCLELFAAEVMPRIRTWSVV